MKVLGWVGILVLVIVGWVWWGNLMEVVVRVPVVGPILRALFGFP